MGLISFGHGMYYCLGGYAVAVSNNFLNINEEKIVAKRHIWAKVAKPPSPEIEIPVTNTINKNELKDTKTFV